ncbi:probable sodium/metabolite cotransporter BASS1, chloroplastic [Corylus avellana]|uniref:probable sodium/metabolite cotransporter BASS1, chloroplastic n=1 Tax=Corylus avellana TaxID=13451 RepID=UPI00286CD64E|nr:probable sodium/metabolite cotransporter BASS1, chloroplastic [Corylus avellana]
MSLSFRPSPFTSPPQLHQRIFIVRHKTPIISLRPKFTNLLTITAIYGNSEHFPVTPSKPRWENLLYTTKLRNFPIINAVHGDSEPAPVTPAKPRWENFLATAASLYPLYVIVGWFVACFKPSAFAWFVKRGPASYSLSLSLIMLAMGITLELKDLIRLFLQRPLSILFGCVAQYTIMPASALIISKVLGLSPSLSVGLILLGCCPGGTASNVVTLIAQGDVPLSIVMTSCTTLAAVLLTPLLTKILAGTYVPVDAIQLSISTLQVVVAPILLGSYLQSAFPAVVKIVTPFTPLFAVLASSLLACSVFSENLVLLKSMVGASLASDLSPLQYAQTLLSGELGVVMLAVGLLHYAGFVVGYISAAIGGFKEPQRRAISIEVGMQNSSLGVVLASSHFSSAMVAVPPAVSAVIMNVMGSSLGFLWRYKDPLDSEESPKAKIDD